jgi:hypothetical protein
MASGIFLIQSSGELVEMKPQRYDSEEVLQLLLVRYPNLLAGDQMNAAVPRRWLLVSREMGVPSEEQGADRWSLDHLFLDQDAVPTLVEVKRSTDTRIRREVVGQMLDYAANGVLHWPVEALRVRFEQECERRGLDPAKALEDSLGVAADVDEFWLRVKTNLQAGRVRLVFVADEIPPELRRVVEFLNGQMDPAEVLAVEIKQYAGQSGDEPLKTLVPRVIGLTKPGPIGVPRQWDERSFFQVLEGRADAGPATAARRLYEWGRKSGLDIRWTRGQTGAFSIVLLHRGREYIPVTVRTGSTNAYVEVRFGHLKAMPPFDDEAKRVEVLRRLREIPGLAISEDSIARYPSVPLSLLTEEGAIGRFVGVLEWLLAEVKMT